MNASYTKPALVVNHLLDISNQTFIEASVFLRTTGKTHYLRSGYRGRSNRHNRGPSVLNINLQPGLSLDRGWVRNHRTKQIARERSKEYRSDFLNTHCPILRLNLSCENSLPHFSVDIREPLTYSVFMNILPLDKQLTILSAMIEGNSIRSTERMTGVHRDTIMRLTARTGEQCFHFLDSRVRGVRAEKVQADEIWTYVFKKQARIGLADDPEMGDQYVFVGMDADTKLVISHLVGKRDASSTYYFMCDLRERVIGRIQLTTDGFKPYRPAVEDTFGGDVDYAQLIKVYGEVPKGAGGRGWYAAAKFVSAYSSTVSGVPRPSAVSTSYVERQNLTMRMQMRRFTRLTNAFSKKLENLKASVALHFAHYNFVRVHQSLRITPAMAAGLTGHVWELDELLEAIQLPNS
jgi:IS1 family transposase